MGLPSHLFSGGVEWGGAAYETGSGWFDLEINHYLTSVYTDTHGGSIILLMGIIETQNAMHTQATLTATTAGEEYLAAWEHRWRVFSEGDIVNYDAVFGNHNDYFLVYSDSIYRNRNVSIPNGQSVYLGFVSVSGGAYDNYYQYGWVQLGYDGDKVYVMNSAVDISGNSIIVGIPEPAILTLVAFGIVAAGLRRRHSIGTRRSI
jgi:hypothetical protein